MTDKILAEKSIKDYTYSITISTNNDITIKVWHQRGWYGNWHIKKIVFHHHYNFVDTTELCSITFVKNRFGVKYTVYNDPLPEPLEDCGITLTKILKMVFRHYGISASCSNDFSKRHKNICFKTVEEEAKFLFYFGSYVESYD